LREEFFDLGRNVVVRQRRVHHQIAGEAVRDDGPEAGLIEVLLALRHPDPVLPADIAAAGEGDGGSGACVPWPLSCDGLDAAETPAIRKPAGPTNSVIPEPQTKAGQVRLATVSPSLAALANLWHCTSNRTGVLSNCGVGSGGGRRAF